MTQTQLSKLINQQRPILIIGSTGTLGSDLVQYFKQKLGEEKDNFVLDARLGFHFVPNSKKIFLEAEENEGAKRVQKSFKDKQAGRENEGIKDDFKKIFRALKERRESERKRYTQFYGVDYEDPKQYDLVINTTAMPPEQVVKKIIEELIP